MDEQLAAHQHPLAQVTERDRQDDPVSDIEWAPTGAAGQQCRAVRLVPQEVGDGIRVPGRATDGSPGG